jgi:tight adherence protein B
MRGAAALSLVPTLLAGALDGTQSPLFSARVEGVRIDVLVTQNGRPMPGLQPGEFEVRDNGVIQAVDLMNVGDVSVNAVLALDVSDSVKGPRLEALQRAGSALLEGLAREDAAALVTFNRMAVRQVPLTRDIGAVRKALEDAESFGDTALVDALLGAMLLGDTDAGRTLIVVFSDGVDTASFTRPDQAVETARRVNAVVYAVSTSEETPRFLRDVTAATSGRVLAISKTGDPGPAFLEILQEFRRRYLITYTPTGVDNAGWHKLEVRVKRPGARVQARTGYFSSRR